MSAWCLIEALAIRSTENLKSCVHLPMCHNMFKKDLRLNCDLLFGCQHRHSVTFANVSIHAYYIVKVNNVMVLHQILSAVAQLVQY